jgi:multiple antibiotic resistance protein
MGKRKKETKDTIALLLGTPLLAGPAAITTSILLVQTYGLVVPLIGLVLALAATYLIMHLGNKLANLVGDRTLDAMSKFMGLLLAAFGIEFIKNGIISIVK